MIGLSVSFCVADILEGRVKLEDVEKIVSGMKCEFQNEFAFACQQYSREYWSKDPDRGLAIARQLWKSGLIVQPRLKGRKPPHLVDTGHWVESESEIRWMEDWVEPGS